MVLVKVVVCYEFGKFFFIEDVELCVFIFGEVEVIFVVVVICYLDIFYVDGVWGGFLFVVYGYEVVGVIIVMGDNVIGY